MSENQKNWAHSQSRFHWITLWHAPHQALPMPKLGRTTGRAERKLRPVIGPEQASNRAKQETAFFFDYRKMTVVRRTHLCLLGWNAIGYPSEFKSAANTLERIGERNDGP